jgi:hydroxyacylglutathione hydrolase
MPHVVSRPCTPFLSTTGAIEVHQIPSAQDNLIWIAVCTQTGEAAAVDGPEAGSVLEYCRTHKIRLTTIINTHTHPDHIGINLDLKKRHQLRSMRVVGPAARSAEIPGITESVREGSRFQIGDATGQVWLTEGHLDGHVSYVIDGVLFCGDTMFGAGCGRMFDGPAEKMYASLKRMATLAPETKVCCAHEYTQDNLRFAWSIERDNAALAQRIQGVWAIRRMGGSTVPSTIGEERATNPFLRVNEPTIRWAITEAFPEVDPGDSVALFAALRAWKDQGDYRAMPDDVLPL